MDAQTALTSPATAYWGQAVRSLPAAKSAFEPDAVAQIALDACAGLIRAYPSARNLRAHLVADLARRTTAQIRWLLREEPAGEPHHALWLANVRAWIAARRIIRQALAAQQAAISLDLTDWREAA